MNTITCPKCGIVTNHIVCPNCGTQLQAKRAYPVYQNNPSNPNMITCSACGNNIYRLAEVCPFCGKPREREVKSVWYLDILCIISVVISIMLFSEPNPFRYAGYLIMLFWMIVYSIIYWAYKDDPDYDISKVKQSRTALAVLFVLTYCIGFVIIF